MDTALSIPINESELQITETAVWFIIMVTHTSHVTYLTILERRAADAEYQASCGGT